MKRSLFWLLDHHPGRGDSVASLYRASLEHAALADELGFDALWIAEHHFRRLGCAPNPAVLLAAIAQRTRRLRLGPAVCVLPLRHPAQVAEDYAMVDLLSRGRLNLGVGAGSDRFELEAMGVDPDRRRELLGRHLAALRAHWRTDRGSSTDEPALNVTPVQSPSPPIFVATMSEAGAHEVGTAGDALLTLVSPDSRRPEEVAARVAAFRRGRAAAGLPPAGAEAVVMAFAHVAATTEAARRDAAPALARWIEAMAGAAPPDPEAHLDQMIERGTGFFGTALEVERLIDRYAALGIDHLAFVSRFGGMPAATAEASLRRLAPARRQGAPGFSA